MIEIKLSKSLEDYLEMIHILKLDHESARVKDISENLGVKMPSVAKAIAELKKFNLVSQEPYGGIQLTKEGEKMAQSIFKRHLLLKQFLKLIGVSEKNANEDACAMEHILSAETLEKVERFVKNAAKDEPKK